MADVGQLLLAPVADLDRRHLVPRGEPEQRRAPVARPEEVGDDEHDAALACDRARPVEGRAERRRADLLGLRLLPGGDEGAEEASAPLSLRDRDGGRAAERQGADAISTA